MRKIKIYFQETASELLTKVSWPTWKELQGSAVVVMIAGLIIAALVYLMDKSFQFIMELVYSLF